SELVKAIRLAAGGHTYLQPELGAKLAAEPDIGRRDLSEREVEVLRLIALGHTNAEIAEQLFLSVRTVESHRAHIQQKLGLTTRYTVLSISGSRRTGTSEGWVSDTRVITSRPSVTETRCARPSIAASSPNSSSAAGRSSVISPRSFPISSPSPATTSREASSS